MKIVIDVPEDLLKRVREAVQENDYDNPRDFITVAIENQVELESIGGNTSDIVSLDQAIQAQNDEPRTDGNASIDPQQSLGNYGPGALGRTDYERVSTVDIPDQSRLDDGPLWGQYNRIFPVKLTLRVLANELRNQAVHATSQVDGSGEEWVSMDRFADEVSDLAREYGLKISQVDKNESRGRGEKLSAALPIGDDAQKSKKRFKSHFVGYAEQNGNLAGAAPKLRLVNIPEDSRAIMGITEPGLKFAELWNPLLDGGVSSDRSLAEDEVTFYLEHVRESLPSEFKAMQFTAEAIAAGDNRPDSLSSRIASLNEEWSEAQSSTVRSGLVSRMSELGLVKRERVGQRRIEYKLSKKGTESLEVNV